MVYNMLMHNNLELPGFKTMQKETTFEAFRQRAEHLRLLSEISSQFAQTLASLKNLNDDERKQEEEENFGTFIKILVFLIEELSR